ncbi:MAG: ATP-grasp domain-containing protein [Sandaracinus sp.]
MNVLVTSASRKVSLVRSFQRAVAPLGGRVVAADCEERSAALFLADRARLLPRSDAPDFWDALVEVIRDEQISLLIPTRDEELPLFAARVDELRALGVTVPISSSRTIALCQDKFAFAQLCEDRGFSVATRVAADELADPARYPVFARTRSGKGGRGAFRVDSRAELDRLGAVHGPLLVQELVRAPELSIDVLADLEGRVLSVVPRERATVVAGESYVSRTVHDPALVRLGARLAEAVALRGHAVIQVFDRRPSELGRIDVIELNPRFGGASALAFEAGADSAELVVRMARGERIAPFVGGYEVGLTMLRYTQDVFVRPRDLEGIHVARGLVRSGRHALQRA